MIMNVTKKSTNLADMSSSVERCRSGKQLTGQGVVESEPAGSWSDAYTIT
jgi:hypothetical protein